MRRVIMKINISGGRADGRAWPPMNEPLVLGDAEAADIVRGRMAAYDEPPGWQRKEPAPAEAPAVEQVVSAASPTADGPAAEDEPPQGDQPPVSYAPKQAWVNWAMAHGASEDEANSATKAQLMEAYGDRA